MTQREKVFSAFLKSKRVSTDTRSIPEGAVFFALKGENFNGNRYAKNALESGASIVVIDELQDDIANDEFILVKDVLQSLQNLAKDFRKQLKGTVIGLTGSNGKTTCKELFRDVLATRYSTVATKGNLNNHIGVPLTLLSIPEETEICIIEMGANHQMEIELLCSIAQPDLGYITNFGKAHLEGFGGIEGVIKGKSELYEYLRAHHKKALINADDELQIKKSAGINQISFGANGDIKIVDLQTDFASAQIGSATIQSNLTGSFHFANIAAAIAIGTYFKVDILKTKKAIEAYMPQMNRTEWRKTETNEILLDAYNANPDSMNAAIKTFARLDKPNKWLILGDMFELGNFSKKEHQDIVDLLYTLKLKNVILVGKAFCTSNIPSSFKCYTNTANSKEFLKSQKLKNCTVLLKGSRGMKLETLIDEL